MTTLDDFQTKAELQTTKKRVSLMLFEDIKARNSDKWLTYRVLQEIAKENGQKIFIPFELFEKFPSYETISRCRRKIQEKGKFLPTDPEVMRKRKMREEDFREWSRS